MTKKLLAVAALCLAVYLGRLLNVSRLAAAAAAPVLGRSGACTFRQSVSTYVNRLDFDGTQIELRKTCKKGRDEAGLTLWSTPKGEFWAPHKTDVIFVLAEQIHEFYGSGPRNVQKGDVVLDAGANIGTFTRTALDRGARLVVAIEPEPHNVEALRRTYAAEIAQGRVIVYPKGVWDKDDVLTMKVYPNSALDTFVMTERVETGDKPVEIKLPLTTIDKLVAELNLDRVDFLKMDIEGAERNALRGAAATLKRWKPRMSIATENLQDDQIAVPRVVHEIEPAYESEFGPCSLQGSEVRPDVAFFRAR